MNVVARFMIDILKDQAISLCISGRKSELCYLNIHSHFEKCNDEAISVTVFDCQSSVVVGWNAFSRAEFYEVSSRSESLPSQGMASSRIELAPIFENAKDQLP